MHKLFADRWANRVREVAKQKNDWNYGVTQVLGRFLKVGGTVNLWKTDVGPIMTGGKPCEKEGKEM